MSASKRKVLDLKDKLRVVELSKSKSCRKIADEFGVGKTQLPTGSFVCTRSVIIVLTSTDLPRPLSNNLWIIPSQKVDWDRMTFSIRKY